MHMKNILNRPQIQFSGTNNRILWMNDKLTYFLDRPLLMLVVPWALYYLFDLGITYFFSLDSRGFAFANITVLIGFASSCVLFFWLIPSFYLQGNRIVPFGVSLVFLTLLLVSKYYLLIWFGVDPDTWQRYILTESLRLFDFSIITFMVWGFYGLFNSMKENVKSEKKVEELEIAHKSLQLSPHFLLNLIGDITGKSIRFSSVLFEDLRHYIKILKYCYEDFTGFNSLAAEVDCVQSYFHSQKLRFEDALSMKTDISEALLDYDDYYMPKMVLLTLVENVFKHGLTMDVQHPILISASLEAGEDGPKFIFKTWNRIKIDKKVISKGGFGQATVQRLLDHYLPDYELQIRQDDADYSLALTISYASNYQNWPDRR